MISYPVNKKYEEWAFHFLLNGFDIPNHCLHTYANPKLSGGIFMLINKFAVFSQIMTMIDIPLIMVLELVSCT